MRREEAEDLVVEARSGSGPVRLFLPGRRRVVDVAREEHRPVLLLHEPHRVILLPALAAEVRGVEAFLRGVGKELLAVRRHPAVAGALDRRIGVPGSRDELMKLEREETPLTCARVRSPCSSWHARHQKKVPQGATAGGRRPAGLGREPGHRLGHRQGPSPDPALVDVGERDAQPRLHPYGERMLPELGVGDVRRQAGIDGLAELGPDGFRGGGGSRDAL